MGCPVKVITMSGMRRASDDSRQHTNPVRAADASLVTRARALSADLLRDDAALRQHSARAASVAAKLTRRIPTSRPAEVVAAAWLHDIGYAAGLKRTGFHPLDGALFLMTDDWPERVIRLVAHHSLAALEAPFYGVGHHLGVIEVVNGPDADILVSADLSSGAGDPIPTVDQRLEAMRAADEALGLVPADVREARYAGLRAALARAGSAA